MTTTSSLTRCSMLHSSSVCLSWPFSVILKIKGEVRPFFLSFYFIIIFIGHKVRKISKCNFHRKAPKWVKNQAKGSKTHEIRTNQPIQAKSYCRNPPIQANTYCRNPLIPYWRIPTVAFV